MSIKIRYESAGNAQRTKFDTCKNLYICHSVSCILKKHINHSVQHNQTKTKKMSLHLDYVDRPKKTWKAQAKDLRLAQTIWDQEYVYSKIYW